MLSGGVGCVLVPSVALLRVTQAGATAGISQEVEVGDILMAVDSYQTKYGPCNKRFRFASGMRCPAVTAASPSTVDVLETACVPLRHTTTRHNAQQTKRPAYHQAANSLFSGAD